MRHWPFFIIERGTHATGVVPLLFFLATLTYIDRRYAALHLPKSRADSPHVHGTLLMFVMLPAAATWPSRRSSSLMTCTSRQRCSITCALLPLPRSCTSSCSSSSTGPHRDCLFFCQRAAPVKAQLHSCQSCRLSELHNLLEPET